MVFLQLHHVRYEHFIFDERMASQIVLKQENVKQRAVELFGGNFARQVLDQDIFQVFELIFDIAVVLFELLDAVTFGMDSVYQSADIGKYRLLLIFEMGLHLIAVIVEKRSRIRADEVTGTSSSDDRFSLISGMRCSR